MAGSVLSLCWNTGGSSVSNLSSVAVVSSKFSVSIGGVTDVEGNVVKTSPFAVAGVKGRMSAYMLDTGE